MIAGYLGMAMVIAIPVFCGWLFVTALRGDFVRARGARYYRETEPIAFWTLTFMYALLTVAFVVLWCLPIADALHLL